jgi:outer membrane protein
VNQSRKGLFFLCLAASLARAEQFPLWEAGVGIGATTLPHYRGSDQSRTWVLPVPYGVYRGESLKVDDDRRIRGLFGEGVELEFSLNGSPPAKSNDARRDMPDLDATLEIGPSLNIALFRSGNGAEKLELRLPVRTVIASDFSHFRYVGWIFQPNLSLDFKNVLGNRGWNLGVQSSLIYTDRRYNQYFYAVDPIFATADRLAFDPGGGYAGTTLLAALSKRFPNFWVGAFAKWDSVGGAVFADSPLIKARSNLSGGFAIAWILGTSTVRVEVQN